LAFDDQGVDDCQALGLTGFRSIFVDQGVVGDEAGEGGDQFGERGAVGGRASRAPSPVFAAAD
jgi:hypothetical protein